MNEVSNIGFERDFEIPLNAEIAGLITQLKDSTIYPLLIDFENFESIGKYQLQAQSSEPTEKDRVAKTIILSRVAFNSDRTKAAYYYQEHCGFLCGYGYIVFVELSSTGWKVIGKNMIWIS